MDSIAGILVTLKAYPVEKELTVKNDVMNEIFLLEDVAKHGKLDGF